MIDSRRQPSHRLSRWALVLIGVGIVDLVLSTLPVGVFDAALAVLEPEAMSAPVDAGDSSFLREVLERNEPDTGPMTYASLDSRKLSGLARTLGILFLLNGVTLAVQSRRPSTGAAVHVFPFAVAASLVILLVGYRIVIHAGVGFSRSGDAPAVPSGIILNEVDNLSYASWAAQAKEGRSWFKVLYTTEKHNAMYFNPFFLAVGWTARALDVPVLTVLHVAGLAAAFWTIVCVYFISLRAGLSVAAARWATFLAAFSSGLSTVTTLLHAWTGVPLFLGVDVIYLEAILSTTFCCWPYQSCMLGLLAASMLCLIVCEKNSGPGSRICVAGLPVLTFLLIASHPYDGLMLFGSYVAFASLSLFSTAGRVHGRRRAVLVALLAVAVLPVTTYNVWVSKQDVWRGFAQVCLGEWRPRWAWLIGYGLTLPLGVAGAVRCLRTGRGQSVCWLAVWTLLVVVLLVGVNVPQTTKLCNGGHLPMCIMAGAACAAIVHRTRQIRRPAQRGGAYVAGCCAVAVMTSNCLGMLLYGFRTHTYDRDLHEVAREIHRDSRAPFPAVLSDVRTARMLTVLVPAHVYAGHHALTPDYHAKRAELIRAGIQFGDEGVAPEAQDPLVLDGLLKKARVDFLVIRNDAPARPWTDRAPRLRFLRQIGAWRLYEVRNDVPRLTEDEVFSVGSFAPVSRTGNKDDIRGKGR